MEEIQSKILSNVNISRDIYKMILECEPIASAVKPGQFVMVALPGYFLRRPISVSETNGKQITLIYKIMGNGTDLMHTLPAGRELNLLGPLGMGFPVVAAEKDVLLLGGGVGVPPLVQTAKAYLEKGCHVDVVLGFNTAEEIFGVDTFEHLGITPLIATMDGTIGTKGTVLDAVAKHNITTSFVLACGPLPMLKAISAQYDRGYISLEARMGCGIGVCNGCVVKDAKGNALRVCKNGPVFPIGKVVL